MNKKIIFVADTLLTLIGALYAYYMLIIAVSGSVKFSGAHLWFFSSLGLICILVGAYNLFISLKTLQQAREHSFTVYLRNLLLFAFGMWSFYFATLILFLGEFNVIEPSIPVIIFEVCFCFSVTIFGGLAVLHHVKNIPF